MSTEPHLSDFVACPYCGLQMQEAWFAIGGTVQFCYSRRAMQVFLSGRRADIAISDPFGADDPNADGRLHMLIGRDGYLSGRWPKDGLYCANCGTMTVKVQPH